MTKRQHFQSFLTILFIILFLSTANFHCHPTKLESGEVLWGLMKTQTLMKTQNKLEGINPVMNIIEHNWLNDHQGDAYMWLDWLHGCHLIIKRWYLKLFNVLRLFHFELPEFSAMKIIIFFLFEHTIWSVTASYYTN